MIRMVQRQLIIPRGDTGTFSIPPLADQTTQADAFVFTIFNPREHTKIFEKVMSFSNGILTLNLTHGDTVNLPIGSYVWDIKFYKNAVIVDGAFIDGDEIDSYYAAYKLPVCEIRQTGDSLLDADDAPTATVNPEQLNIITAAAREIHDATITVTEAAQTATEKAGEAAATATSVAALFTPTVGAPTYVQNNYIENLNFAASYTYKYPIGIAIISIRFAVTASLTSSNVKFGELGFGIPVETRVSLTNQSGVGSCLVTIGTDGSLYACALGESKPGGWGVYNFCITLPTT